MSQEILLEYILRRRRAKDKSQFLPIARTTHPPHYLSLITTLSVLWGISTLSTCMGKFFEKITKILLVIPSGPNKTVMSRYL